MTSGSRSGFCVLANRMVTLTSGMSGRQTTSSQRSGHREETFPNSFHLISGWPDCQLWWSAQFWWAKWSKGWCQNTLMSFKMFKTLKDWKMLMKLFQVKSNFLSGVNKESLKIHVTITPLHKVNNNNNSFCNLSILFFFRVRHYQYHDGQDPAGLMNKIKICHKFSFCMFIVPLEFKSF